MALNLDAMKAKLDKLNGKSEGRKNFWRPEDGESNIRIVSTPDGDPFKERFFHYGVGGQSFLCPKRNFGDDCPACNFANKLWNEGTEESIIGTEHGVVKCRATKSHPEGQQWNGTLIRNVGTEKEMNVNAVSVGGASARYIRTFKLNH